MFRTGILGINSRNLLYIKKFNPQKSIRLADNKLKSKNFLKERGIPVPETYGTLSSRKQVYNFDFSQLPKKSFVIKPNKGSGGKGINLVKIREDVENIESSNKNFFGKKRYIPGKRKEENSNREQFFQTNQMIFDRNSFNRYLVDIVDGRYSLTFSNDSVIIEERLTPSEKFKKYCKHGLADIRIITFNLIPVAAMVRFPTYESGGKANLSQGGVGLGIEIGSGKIKSMYYKRQIFTKEFPGELKEFYNKKVPFREDLMLFSSRIQYFENLGFLGLDWVITEEGPKILEINSRAGLEVQNAAILPLRKRLEKIGDTKVKDPEKGVEIAKSLFTSAKTNISLGKVLYLSQKANLILESSEEDIKIPIKVEIDLNKEDNFISPNLHEKIKNHEEGDALIDIYENEIRFKNLLFTPSERIKENKVILGKHTVKDYYIKPVQQIYSTINVINNENIVHEELEDLTSLDQTISDLSKKLNLSYIFRPTNYLDELDNFITWNGNYNPKFEYKRPSDKKLEEIRDQLLRIQEENFSRNSLLKSNFAELFAEKIEELLIRYNLIIAYKNQRYKDILKYNELLYGEIDKNLLNYSRKKLFLEEESNESKLGPYFSSTQTKNRIKKHLQENDMSGIEVVSHPQNLARISVYKGKKSQIRISNLAKFREKELRSVIAHEIDTHLLRFLNGMASGWSLLKSGTGFYIKDEEGIGIYKSYQHLPEGYETKGIYEKYHLTRQAQKYEFSRLVDLIRGIKDIPLNRAFNGALRYKKGIINTGFVNPGAINLKNKIYLEGYQKINKRIEEGGDLERLLIGKIKIQDLEYL